MHFGLYNGSENVLEPILPAIKVLHCTCTIFGIYLYLKPFIIILNFILFSMSVSQCSWELNWQIINYTCLQLECNPQAELNEYVVDFCSFENLFTAFTELSGYLFALLQLPGFQFLPLLYLIYNV